MINSIILFYFIIYNETLSLYIERSITNRMKIFVERYIIPRLSVNSLKKNYSNIIFFFICIVPFLNKLDNRTRDKIIRKRSTSSNNKQISPSFNSPRSSEILTQLHSSPWWNSIRRHNFRPRKFTYPEPRLALKFRDTPPSDLDKIHLLSTKIHRDRSRSRRPNEVLSPLKQRERGLPRIESDGVSPKPPPPLFRRWLPRWHFRLRGTSNEKPHAQCRVRRQTGLFAYHRGG